MTSPRSSFLRSRFLRSKPGAITTIAVLVLILFLVRPGVHRLRTRISTSIGNALGRRVAIDNVRFHLLPRPGFDLEGLVIYDDPDFSAEPMIRSDEVSAAIRFRSLLRGRLEIATLSANEPSINLVRSARGRWNLASLLERNAQIPAAPTGKSGSQRRPAFPYLEASNARVNFKFGETKKSYALMNADVALWQDSENSWGARISAEPVRTDFHLTDTGLVQISARWFRAPSLRLTPLEITVQWQKGQLGQITQLLSGKDRGWRGAVNFAARLSGTPEALRIASQTGVEDFRRYDMVNTENERLATACSGLYNAVTGALGDLLCEAPVSGGALRLRGSATMTTQSPSYDLTLEAENVPLASVVRLLRQTKKRIPADLTASGSLNAEFHVQSDVPKTAAEARHGLLPPGAAAWNRTTWTGTTWSGTTWTGKGSATDVRLSSNGGADEIAFDTIPLTLISKSTTSKSAISQSVSQGTTAGSKISGRVGAGAEQRAWLGHPITNVQAQRKDLEPPEVHLRIGPAALAINGSAPVDAAGWISTAGYLFSLRGDAELKDLFRLQHILGLQAARPAADGSAKLDISISGPWQGFTAPSTLGSAQLRNVHAEVLGLNTPIEIGSASVFLTQEAVSMQKISARTGSSHWTGDVTSPRHCSAVGAQGTSAAPVGIPDCVFQFDLTADQLSAGDIAEWFTPHPVKRPWYRILNSNSNEWRGYSPLLAIQARGALRVGRFGLKKLVATQIVTQAEVDRGKITLSAVRAQLLQGTHRGNWVLDVSSREEVPSRGAPHEEAGTQDATPAPPLRLHGTGTVQNISLEPVGTLLNDAWITGQADGNFDWNGSGNNFRELLARSEGTLQFVMRNGGLPNIDLPGLAAPLSVHRFTGDLQLKKGVWELSSGRLESHGGFYTLSGTASQGSICDFILTRGDDQSYAITGTLAKPRVAPIIRTQARTEAHRSDVSTTGVKP